MTTDGALPSTTELWNLLQEQQERMDRQAAELAELRRKAARVDRLEAELERQRVEKVELSSRLAEVEDGRRPAGKRLSRAGLLKAAAAGAAGLAAGTALGGPTPAFAGVDGDVVLSSAANTGTSETAINAGASYPSSAVFRGDASTNGNTANIDGLQGQGSGTFSGVAGWGGSSGGRGVTGFGGGTTALTSGPGVVGVGAGVTNPTDPLGAYGVYGVSNHNPGVVGVSTTNAGIIGQSTSGLGGAFNGPQANLSLHPLVTGFPTSGGHNLGELRMGPNGTVWVCTKDGAPGTWVPLMYGNSNDRTNSTIFTAVSTQQYTLSNSDGVTWMDMDATNLSLTITPQQDCWAIITGNSDLWTSQAGYNQDIGITLSGVGYPTTPGQPEAWKESGGFAGTFSPNAAFVQTLQALAAGTAYTITLQWKTNKNASGATIWAGAGPIGGKFSPTRLTALLIPAVPFV